MARLLLVSLSLCLCWTSADRSYWSEKPKVIMSDEVMDGETVKVSCTLPIDYSGGQCRLYRGESGSPFKVVTTSQFICTFYLSTSELLGPRPVGSFVRLRCDYHLQQYTSVKSDSAVVTVWGSSPSPRLSVGRRRLTSPSGEVEVSCHPPLPSVASCHFYRDGVHVGRGSCSRNLTGRGLAKWERAAPLLPVNLTCRYFPRRHLSVRSEPSNHRMLFVVDATQTTSPMNCNVSLEDDQLAALGGGGGGGLTFGDGNATVTVRVTNSSEIFSCSP